MATITIPVELIDTVARRAAAALAAKHAEINAERTRRVRLGKVINGVYVTSRDEDARNLTNLALGAQLRIAGEDSTALTTYRDGDNVDHELTPPQLLSLWQQSAEYVSALYVASWTIMAMNPLPADVTADALWPSQAA